MTSELQSFIKKLAAPLSLLEFEVLAKEINKTFPRLPEEARTSLESERLMKDLFYKKLSVYKAYRYD